MKNLSIEEENEILKVRIKELEEQINLTAVSKNVSKNLKKLGNSLQKLIDLKRN